MNKGELFMKKFMVPLLTVLLLFFGCGGGKKKGFLPILGLVLTEDASSSGETTNEAVSASTSTDESGNLEVPSTVTNSESVIYTTSVTPADITQIEVSHSQETRMEEEKTSITNTNPSAKVEVDTKVTEEFVYQTTREILIDTVVYDSNGSIMPNTLIKITDGSPSNPESNIIFQQITDENGHVGGSITVDTATEQVEAIVSLGENSSNPVPIPLRVKDCGFKEHDDNGHGNDADGYDESNPGKSDGISTNENDKQANDNNKQAKKNNKCNKTRGINKIGDIIVPVDFNRIEKRITDGDGDGVDDMMDFYPDDPNKASRIRFPSKGVYTISYEDLFPSAGDADLNDYTIQFYNEEDLNAKGEIVEIRGYYQHVAKGAGYNHTLNLRFPDSVTIELFETEILDANGSNTKNGQLIKFPDLAKIQDGLEILGNSKHTISSKNSSKNQKYRPGHIAKMKVVFGKAVPRNTIGSFPYDLFIKILSKRVNNRYPQDAPRSLTANKPYYEVHFPGKYFYANGKDVYIDKKGFPWAIMVPGVWAWPYERQDIRNSGAYPKFNQWAKSNGTEATDWYKDVIPSKVFPVDSEPSRVLLESGSGLLAYLNGTTIESKLLYLLLGVIFITGSALLVKNKFIKVS